MANTLFDKLEEMVPVKRGRPEDDRNQYKDVYDAYQAGYTLQQIAKASGVTKSAIHKRIKKYEAYISEGK